ncbi:sensor histidine kinase [Pseudonocardia parietis]|uniref:histidine kinase n=1 Tax=Pseudonocardia parietis TaxID=570936 RepID=A0ABS4W3C1_9PSEU|nr:sensor histidine kinase [Pseudonocardia parietis]MBP2370623.1 signal transduction histidine kinase [Pseudonocardia parietis]
MPSVRDVLLALAVAVVAVAGALLADASGRPLLPWGVVLIGVAALALCWRSSFPVPVLAAVMVPTALYYWHDHPDGPASLLVAVAVYTVASRTTWPRAVLAGLVVVAAWTGTEQLVLSPPVGVHVDRYLWIVVTTALGVAVGAVRRAAQASAERTEERLARHVEQERLRIARDVHDVVSHSLSMIVVQAGVGAHVAARRPEEAVAALERIRDAGTDALRELRGTLDLLRSPDDSDPMPGGLDRLDEIESAGRAAGIAVRVSGTPGPLPAQVDRAAFGIVREAVTNTVRHAPEASEVRVSLDRAGGLLRLRISDDGGGVAATPAAGRGRPPGQGLRGLTERAEALGGNLTAGPGADGWTVDASLPATAAPSGGSGTMYRIGRRARDRASIRARPAGDTGEGNGHGG